MNPPDAKSPPLPDEARRALAAFRNERPSLQLQARVAAALEAADAGRTLPKQDRPARARSAHPFALRMALGTAMASLLALVAVRFGHHPPGESASRAIRRQTMPSREIAARLPAEGPGWAELPLSLHAHPEGLAQVHLETPAALELQQHADGLPGLQLVGCSGERCVHRFTAPTGASAQPLRLRIREPGRYVVRASHASDTHHIDEHFVLVAER